jgi:hypothetical protein
MDFFRKAGDIWRSADRSVGGWLPGGGTASPLSQVKKVINETGLRATGVALNTLPDRVNLFARYMTGVGNRNLQLDPSTLSDLRNATEKTPTIFREREVIMMPGNVATKFKEEVPTYGPGFPQSGPVNPYGSGFDRDAAPKSVTNTLGRFSATVNPSKNTIRIQDKYDMVNEIEDPDLVSGKVQPQKAWNEIEAIWNPAAAIKNLNIQDKKFIPPDKQYNPQNVQKAFSAAGENPTYSPATRFARAFMYLSGVKPEPYEVNVTVPMQGVIR